MRPEELLVEERISEIVHVPQVVEQFTEELKNSSRDRVLQRSVEETVEIPKLAIVEKTDENLEILMVQGQTGMRPQRSSTVGLGTTTHLARSEVMTNGCHGSPREISRPHSLRLPRTFQHS